MRPHDTVRPRVRSALFVPAQRHEFLARIAERDVDAVILDLEDAVAEVGKPSARGNAARWLAERPVGDRPIAMARINALSTNGLDDDLDALVSSSLEAVLVPKIRSEDDVREVADRLSWFEGKRAVPRGRIAIWPIIETAQAVERVEQIARASSRVAYLGGGTSQEGDLARDVGFEWSVDGFETLYIRSRVLIAARAAGIHNPMTGLVSALADPDAVERFARQARQLGYSGMMVIHPAHVETANRVFTPTAGDLDRARDLIRALDDAGADGTGAVAYDGRMIDVAMARTAHSLVADAELIRRSTGQEGSR